MPPNLLVKTVFVRGELGNTEKSNCGRKDAIRTDFILQNIYCYSLKNRYPFNAVCAMNKKEEHVLKELKETFNAFMTHYGDNIKNMCSGIEVTEETIGSVILGVSSELFCEGITWSRIIALFSFVGEFALQCLTKKFPDQIVDEIYECFCRLVKENMISWVDDHGGWEGLTTLSVTQGNFNTIELPRTSNPGNPGWAKSLLFSTVRMIGTLAQIANSSSHALP